MRIGYNARLSVVAAWALEFAPVNVSVIFAQSNGHEHYVIGSRSFMFVPLAECVAEVRSSFPWRCAEHVIPPESRERVPVWGPALAELGIYASSAPELEDAKRILLLQAMLSRLHIDTAARSWEPSGRTNNELLVDSLNGYRMKELSGFAGVFTQNVMATHERYLTRALEHYAAWEWAGGGAAWPPKRLDWSKVDRAKVRPRARAV